MKYQFRGALRKSQKKEGYETKKLYKDGPFIKINCAALTETLLESELFGHERGAFTGADRRNEGKFKQRELTRVGGEEVVKEDVRLIAATNRDLFKEIKAGRFRDDLFYSLNVITLHVPSLRERREDIPLLAQHFLGMFAEKNRKTFKGFTPQAMDHLLKYDWPGNVRELMNSIERGVVLSRGEYLDVNDLSLVARPGAAAPADLSGQPLEEVERAAIIRMLDQVNGNKSEAARRLGITRRTLHQNLG